ncbi:MAG: ATP-binding protein, partial [Candidatus Riflebacteria bacterium]|nr:ATP-binding protein [Candidatus Riflebacteria bacterium]
MTTTPTPQANEALRERSRKLGLYGLEAHWKDVVGEPWVEPLIKREEDERGRRSHDRRVKQANLGRFKPIVDFDWIWPKKIDREQIEELFTLGILGDNTNVIFVSPNGLGKTMLCKNLGYTALLAGHTVYFTTASQLLNDLGSQDGAQSLERRLRKYTRPRLLVIDELGYLSYDSRSADLLFEVVTRRYQEKSTVISTNRAFGEWNETFPNAACVVTLIARLIHHSEIVEIEGESYRCKEALERAEARAKARRTRRRGRDASTKERV